MNRTSNFPRQTSALVGGTGVRADSRAIQARQHDANHTMHEVTGHTQMVDACINILNGVPGECKIFSITLGMEARAGKEEKFPAIYYLGSNNEKFEKAFVPGQTWIAVEALFRNPESINWKGDVRQEALARTLLKQPAMQEAVKTVKALREQQAVDAQVKWEKEEQERNEAAANLLKELLGEGGVDNNTQPAKPNSKKPKPFYEEFQNIQDLLGDKVGIFRHPTGAVFKLCSHENGLVVYLNKVDVGHELESLANTNLFIFQKDLKEGTPSLPESIPRYEERNVMLSWLLSVFSVATSGTKEFEVAADKAAPANITTETSTADQKLTEVTTSPVVPIAVVSVDDVLGDAATNGVRAGTKPGVPAKRAVKSRAIKDKVLETA